MTSVFRVASIPKGGPHRLRNTFAVALLQRGVALATVRFYSGIGTGYRSHTEFPTSETELVWMPEAGRTALKNLPVQAMPAEASKRVYSAALDNFHEWYFAEPRPPFTRSVVQQYRTGLEKMGTLRPRWPYTSPPCTNWPKRPPTMDCWILKPQPSRANARTAIRGTDSTQSVSFFAWEAAINL